MTGGRVSPDLLKSGLFAIGVHAALMVPFVFGVARWSAPQADVMSGLSSIELEWVAPESPAPVTRETVPSPEDGPEAVEQGSSPAPESWLADNGALNAKPVSAQQNAAPHYPRVARIQGWEGTVLVRAWVTPSGGVASARIAQSSGRAALDGAALAAVQKWRFRPASRKGKPVASRVEVPITFRLEPETRQQRRDQ